MKTKTAIIMMVLCTLLVCAIGCTCLKDIMIVNDSANPANENANSTLDTMQPEPSAQVPNNVISEEDALVFTYEAIFSDLKECYDDIASALFVEEYPQHEQTAILVQDEDSPYWDVTISGVAINVWNNLIQDEDTEEWVGDWYRISYYIQVDAITGEVLQVMKSR